MVSINTSPVSLLLLLGTLLLIGACKKELMDPQDSADLSRINYDPITYTLDLPNSFPMMEIPENNLMTIEGVELGRKLFYDPILSADSTMSCSSCHLQKGSFTDNRATSEGIDGISGTRSSMSLLNTGFISTGLFWDGRADNLEELALLPVEDPIELHDQWPNVEKKLMRNEYYPRLFREAFGIERKNEITSFLAAKAIAQFVRTLNSTGNSKWDQVQRNEVFFTDQELEGFLMFFDEDPSLPDAECGHCHSRPLFTTNEFINNGIEPVTGLSEFPDKGLGKRTQNLIDNGKFRVPTLRNIELTGPYMHDGRFENLNQVLEHYNSGGHVQPNTDVLIRPLNLSTEQQEAIIAFLKTLTDSDFVTKEEFSSPFE